MIFTYPKRKYDEKAIDKELITKLINQHSIEASKFILKKKYYLGEHAIKQAVRRNPKAPNNKIVSNHAKNIADTSTGYFIGNPIKYETTTETDLEKLLVAFDNANVDENDHDNALDMAICGVAYEYIYVKEGTNELDIKNLEPENTFIVYDDSIEQVPLFAVYYFKQHTVDDENLYKAYIFTENYRYDVDLKKDDKGIISNDGEPHFMKRIPVIMYQNNKHCIGDFEQQISLIDAYNTIVSGRVNDKEQFIDAVLVMYGANLADDEEEAQNAMRALTEHGLLELPSDAKAEYLLRTLDEAGVDILAKAIREDIYTFSHVPNLSDENFAGNTSGVAMEFKLLGLETHTKIKERYYKKGLRERINIFANYLNLADVVKNADSVVPLFSRGLPKNLLELSQIVGNLDGKVSQRKLLSLLPFVEDPDAELKALEEQEEVRQNKFEENKNEPLAEQVEEDE